MQFFRRGEIPVLLGHKLSSAHCLIGNSNLWSHLWLFANRIMQTCSPSNKVGLFAEIQPRLLPVETVVRELEPDWRRGEGRCGAFGSISSLSSSKALLLALVYVLRLFSRSSLLSLSHMRDKHAHLPCTRHYVMVCVGYGSYVDIVITVLYAALLPCWVWEIKVRCHMMLW